MDPETRAYLDGEWTAEGKVGVSAIFGPDGDPIAVLKIHNAAHLLTPRDVAEYLMEIHEEHRKRLREKEP